MLFAYARTAELHYTPGARGCAELKILAAPARILREPCRFLLQSWPQNATAFASFNAKEFPQKTCKNGFKSNKIHENGPKWRPSKKISSKDRKRAKREKLLDPPGHPKSAKIEKKGVSKIDVFFDPLLEPTLSHFRLPQAPQKQPK